MADFFELLAGHKVAVFNQALDSKLVAETLATGMKKSTEPFVVMSIKKVVERFQEWQEELPGVKPYYAVKCNDDVVFLKTLGNLGVGFNCTSKAQIDMIIKEDIAPVERIIFAHPVKTPEFLKYASKVGVPRAYFDSEEELQKMKALAPGMEGILRITCSDDTPEQKLKYKIGCDASEAAKLLQKAKEIGVSVVGVSADVGNRCTNPKIYEKAIIQIRNIFNEGISIGHQMTLADIGSGFPGISENITLPVIGHYVNAALEKYFPESENYEIIADPGRHFATTPFSSAAKICGRVKVAASRITEKDVDADKIGYMYYINDGHYMTFSMKHFDNVHPIGQPLTDDDGTLPRIPGILYGPTCDSLDVVEAVTYQRKLNVGEWFYWENVGAYSTATAVPFNGFPKAKVYYYADQQTMHIIKAGENNIL